MKGIVFTEFLDLVEEKFGLQTVQELIDKVPTETNGSYTAIGTYNHQEMFALVHKLSEISNIAIPDLLELYGEHFFGVLKENYPHFLLEKDLFIFLNSIDNYIHPEVHKLYPDAELPAFEAKILDEKEMVLQYSSKRKMFDFAVGLLRGAAKHFNNEIKIDIIQVMNEGEIVQFKLTRI